MSGAGYRPVPYGSLGSRRRVHHASQHPQLRTAIRRIPLAGARALQHRRRCLRPLGRAGAGPARDPERARRRPHRGDHATAGCARPRTGSPMRLRAHGIARGDRVAILLPQAPEVGGRRISRSTSSAPSRCRSRSCSASMRWPTGCRMPARRRSSPMRKGWRSSPRSRDRAAGARAGALDRRAGRGRARLARDDRARVRSVHARRHRADDPALMIYTSGTTGQPKGALHAHRVLLGHLPGVEMPHEFFPQPGDRFWTPADWAWAGGLLDVPAAEPALRRAGGGAPVREVRSGGGLRADGASTACATPSSRRPRCACCARRRIRAGATTSGCARSAPAARRSAPRPTNGAATRSGSRSTSSTARPSATWCSSSCAGDRRVEAGRDRQAGAGPRRRGDPRRRPRADAGRDSARSRCSGPIR